MTCKYCATLSAEPSAWRSYRLDLLANFATTCAEMYTWMRRVQAPRRGPDRAGTRLVSWAWSATALAERFSTTITYGYSSFNTLAVQIGLYIFGSKKFAVTGDAM